MEEETLCCSKLPPLNLLWLSHLCLWTLAGAWHVKIHMLEASSSSLHASAVCCCVAATDIVIKLVRLTGTCSSLLCIALLCKALKAQTIATKGSWLFYCNGLCPCLQSFCILRASGTGVALLVTRTELYPLIYHHHIIIIYYDYYSILSSYIH